MNVVLFDLEGTLVETVYQRNPEKIIDLRSKTREHLIKIGVPKSVLKGLVRSTTMRNSAYHWAKKEIGSNEAVKLRDSMENFMADFDVASARRARLYPDTLGSLKDLWRGNILMAIVTNTSSKAALHMLGKLGLGQYFAAVVTRSDVEKMKPDPSMIWLVEERLGIEANWLVGDAQFDAEAATAADISSIIIRRDGVRPNFRHDHFISSLHELAPFLGLK